MGKLGPNSSPSFSAIRQKRWPSEAILANIGLGKLDESCGEEISLPGSLIGLQIEPHGVEVGAGLISICNSYVKISDKGVDVPV
ncbi:hypothetical protein V6N11_030724 [Hibiscus sabdariffa]|uniref:Uncharacterized protein n=1 Tax=Hibiscus sabdariffa TaxID=183260 RepID=A0ABR2NBK2_9ROSI